MKHNYFLALLLLIFPMVCFSQIEMKDTISLEQNPPDRIQKSDSKSGLIRNIEYHRIYEYEMDPPYPYGGSAHPVNLNISDFHFTPGQEKLLDWNSGMVIATGGTRSFPGLMQIDGGTLGIYQSAGNFTFRAGGMVNKYGYFNGLQTQYSLNGSITYQFTPRLSATIFGDYYFGSPSQMVKSMPMPPSIIGYYGRSTYGGYVDIQINEHWGVQTGVQTVQQIGTNKYQAEPIVTPYYKINKKVAIGLPVGQILYNILKK